MIKTWKDVKVGDKLWACEYGYNYNRTEKALIQPPVYGQIVKGKYYTSFTILKKDGMPRTSGTRSCKFKTLCRYKRGMY